MGWTILNRNFLSTIIRILQRRTGGSWKPLPPQLNEEVDTLVDYGGALPVATKGFVSRTKSGRKANEPAYRLLNLPIARRCPTKSI